jgi:hypothetical protein
MKGYKAFDKNWKCRGIQYKIGETVKHDGEIKLCDQGLHFCENPLDVLRYYPADSKFAEVDADKVSDETKPEDTKRVCKELKLSVDVNLSAIIQTGVSWLISKCKTKNTTSGDYSPSATSGYNSHSATSGDYSPSATSGYNSHSATSGDYSPSATSGKNSISCAIGYNAKAKASKGEWIVLAEYDAEYNVKCVKTIKVTGKIKPDTFYKLVNGKFTEVKE